MNHSCCPNAKAFKRDENKDGHAVIIALTPISKDEELKAIAAARWLLVEILKANWCTDLCSGGNLPDLAIHAARGLIDGNYLILVALLASARSFLLSSSGKHEAGSPAVVGFSVLCSVPLADINAGMPLVGFTRDSRTCVLTATDDQLDSAECFCTAPRTFAERFNSS
ncbi:unnamed protein product [Miscanthus lutarioriparius]|uniref:SET domain-containing protein n=1 Tax=Miscanthus lutarioriparius TaxID=422564 RepID=A0A811S429_9POAL|nr:unnamed protein product [Miscanthus lutarioriparius]